LLEFFAVCIMQFSRRRPYQSV